LVSWLVQHRGLVLIVLAVSAVVLPLFLGVALGHIPRQVFAGSAVPLAAATFLLAAGVHAISNYVNPAVKFAISLLFGLIWIGAGVQMLRIERHSSGGPPQAAQARRGIGYTFIVFGFIWVTIALTQFLIGGHNTYFGP
jgi:hypothetical protein